MAFSSIMRPTGVYSLPRSVMTAAAWRRRGQRIAQRRGGDEGGARQVQAHASISIWLLLAVP
jgi:hypothetical protein